MPHLRVIEDDLSRLPLDRMRRVVFEPWAFTERYTFSPAVRKGKRYHLIALALTFALALLAPGLAPPVFGDHLPAAQIYDPFDPNQRPDDDPSGGAGQQHIVPGAGGDRIPPPVGPQGMEDGNIGSDRLGHYYLSARIERIVLDGQIRAIGQQIGVEQTAHSDKGHTHRSSLDHAVQRPSSTILHVEQARPHGALKVGCRAVGAEDSGAGFVAVRESVAGQGYKPKAADLAFAREKAVGALLSTADVMSSRVPGRTPAAASSRD